MYHADSMVSVAGEGSLTAFTPIYKAVSGLDLVHVTSAPATDSFEETLEYHRGFKARTLLRRGTHHVRSGSDLSQERSTGVIFGLRRTPAEMTPNHVCELAAEGVLSMALVDSGKNEYGSGFDEEGGLTNAGKDVIRWMGQAGVILDLSHANEQTALDALHFIKFRKVRHRELRFEGLSTGVMASHSGCRAVEDAPENLSDKVIAGICDLHGYLGIPISLPVDVDVDHFSTDVMEAFDRFAEHITHAVTESGNDTIVGIGSDYSYRPGLYPMLEDKLKHLPAGIFGENFKNFLLRALPC